MPSPLTDRLRDLLDELSDREHALLFAKIGGDTVAHVRKFLGLCQRCGQRPPDGSGIMCRECWVDTGSYDRKVTV